jgi:hypothetical protein
MDRSLRRELTLHWLRGILAAGLVLAIPAGSDAVVRALDSSVERRELGYAVEREQRAGGETFVTPSGRVARAVVYTPMYPSEAEEISRRRQFVRWCRLLAVLTVLGLLAKTWRILRDDRVAHVSRVRC